MPEPEVKLVVAEIISFVDASLQPAVDYDRDRAEQIARNLLRWLDGAVDWDAGVEALAVSLGSEFSSRATPWVQVCRLLEIFFQTIWVEAHPRANTGVARTGTVVTHPVRVPIVRPFLRTLIAHASPEQVAAFYETLEPRDAELWSFAAEAVFFDSGKPHDICAFLVAHGSRNETLYTNVADPIRIWAATRADDAIGLVEAWLVEEPAVARANVGSIQVLIEAVARGVDRRDWRDAVLGQLLDSARPERSNLAVTLECYAWPQGTPAEQRHGRLLACVKRAPWQFIQPALWALARRDARDEPKQSLVTAAALLTLAHESGAVANAPGVLIAGAEVIATIARALVAAGAAKPSMDGAVDALIAGLEPKTMHPLDGLFAEVKANDFECPRRWCVAFLDIHAQMVVRSHLAFGDMFPLLSHSLGPVTEHVWLLGFLGERSDAVRRAAASMIGALRADILPDALASLSDLEAKAFLYEVVGYRDSRPKGIAALLRLAVTRRRLRSDIESLMIADLVRDYPGPCGAGLAQLVAPPTAGKEEVAELSTLKANIQSAIDKGAEGHRAARAVPEIARTTPSFRDWLVAEQRVFDRALEMGRARSVFANLAQKVPLVRGGESLMTAIPNAAPRSLEKHEFSKARSIADVVDPHGASMRMAQYLRRAEEIRNRGQRL